MAYGRQERGTIGTSIQLSADGRPLPKLGGLTLDWATFAARSGSDLTLLDGFIIKIGEKFARYGQIVTRITASGLYGPYDPAAVDGRELLVRGRAYAINKTVVNNDPESDYPEAIEGGRIWRARLIQSEAATHTLALGPTFAEIIATFPNFTYVE